MVTGNSAIMAHGKVKTVREPVIGQRHRTEQKETAVMSRTGAMQLRTEAMLKIKTGTCKTITVRALKIEAVHKTGSITPTNHIRTETGVHSGQTATTGLHMEVAGQEVPGREEGDVGNYIWPGLTVRQV